jgi:hypothetical protein
MAAFAQNILTRTAAAVVVASLSAVASAQTTTLTDSGPSAAYNSGFTLTPGTSGFGNWTEYNTGGGGRFMETGGAQVGSGRSWGLFANSGTNNNYALGRPLNDSAAVGSATIVARHNVDNSRAFSGFNLKFSNNSSTGGFGQDELLSFGLTPSTGNGSVFVGGSSSTSLSISGVTELRGATVTYTVSWNTILGTYSLNAAVGANSAGISGSLKSSGNPLRAIGAGNFNWNNNQNLIFNDLTVTIPEPAQLRNTVPSLGTNQATLSLASGPYPKSATFTSTNRGYFTLNDVPSGYGSTGAPQVALAVTSAQLTNVVALLNSRASVNGYTVTTVAPAWASGLGSAFNVFLQFTSASAGTNYVYWDVSSLPSAGVTAVAAVPEPGSIGVLGTGAAGLLRRRRGRA